MYDKLDVEIVGVAPLIMHNGQTSDPMNKFARMMKEISSKRKKTEADFEELARIEYMAGLYMGDDGPIIPARMLEAALTDGARKAKAGRLASAGIMIEQHARLDYDGPRTPKDLFADDRFRLAVPVRVGQAKIIRTRPIFPEWSAKVCISYQGDIINRRDVEAALRAAGMYAGIGDWRPRHGRFVMRQDLPVAMAAE